MQTTPFWTNDYPRPHDLPTAALPAEADVAIVGGGYTGLNAALTLARAGASVVVIEAETIGWGASSRNGGMMTTGLKDDMPHVCKRYGMERGRRFWAWALASIDYVEGLVKREAIACDFARRGHLHLAFKPSHFDAMQESIAWYADRLDYHEMHRVGRRELMTEIGTDVYYGATVDTRAGGLHPAKYVFGLAQAAARAGVRLVEHARVEHLERSGAGWRIAAAGRTLQAREALLATNGYTTGLVPYVRRGVFPVGSYIITTAPLAPDLQAALSPRGRMFFDSKHFLNYFRLTPDGRMLFGGRHNLSPSLDLRTSARMMQERLVEVFPQLQKTPLSHTWNGRLGLTFDLMPHVGRVPDGPHAGLFFAYGYAGHGLSVASYLGHQVGRWLAGAAESPLFAQVKQQRYFFTQYDAAYLPLVSAWFRMLDRVA